MSKTKKSTDTPNNNRLAMIENYRKPSNTDPWKFARVWAYLPVKLSQGSIVKVSILSSRQIR